MEVGPSMALAEVRAGFEEALPHFCEVKLLQGTWELTDGAVVEVELQAVVSKSPAKAVTALEALT